MSCCSRILSHISHPQLDISGIIRISYSSHHIYTSIYLHLFTMATGKKIVLVTGANTGLGYEIIKALYQTDIPYEIIVGCRTISKGEAAIAKLKEETTAASPSSLSTLQVDLNSDASLESAVDTLEAKYGRLDVLINNGGCTFDTEVREGKMPIRDGFNATWDTNVSGTHFFTTLAVPLLLNSADPRLLFVTSGTTSMAETEVQVGNPGLQRLNAAPPAGWPKPRAGMELTMYRVVKTGLNMLMRDWTRRLRNDGVKVWGISPGFLATGFAGMAPEKWREMGALDPALGGQFIRDVVAGKRDQDVGKVIRAMGIQPW
ncbi:NAD(P)-binding protein [Annulohypoxylon truncatum]|uniref:NAD(P)-binding protein n=1 Tax=Annulohypoxylon truncatum TaxID=327061 RepID=UPI0020073682|nr:NAD(P)-binding protein [Annulohypoxylon truncatum]KAI1212026.1 NAD(P)-binding protein [Annulohypoxylon truncatum]